MNAFFNAMENQKLYIDCHTHLDWYEDQELLIKQLVESGIICIAASVDAKSFKKNQEIARKVNQITGKQQIIPTMGVHPCKVSEMLNQVQHDERFLNQSPLIGEIGMDFCWYKDASPEQQEEVFRYFLDHCNKYKKYCVIHTKDAEQQIEDILLEYPDAKPIIHWYDGPEDIYREFIRRQYMTTFGCETSRSEHIQKLLKITPPELILCETDNPTGETWLGGTDNTPMLIKRVYSDVAKVLGMSEDDLIQQVQKNWEKVMNHSYSLSVWNTSLY